MLPSLAPGLAILQVDITVICQLKSALFGVQVL